MNSQTFKYLLQLLESLFDTAMDFAVNYYSEVGSIVAVCIIAYAIKFIFAMLSDG